MIKMKVMAPSFDYFQRKESVPQPRHPAESHAVPTNPSKIPRDFRYNRQIREAIQLEVLLRRGLQKQIFRESSRPPSKRRDKWVVGRNYARDEFPKKQCPW